MDRILADGMRGENLRKSLKEEEERAWARNREIFPLAVDRLNCI